MLERLLESGATRERSVGGTIASVTGHSALIAAALYATAQAHVEPLKVGEVVRVHYMTAPIKQSTPKQSNAMPANPVRTWRPIFVDLKVVAIPPSLIESTPIVASSGDFVPGALSSGGSGGGTEVAEAPDGIFRADQVERQVGVLSGSTPRYPETLRLAGVEGQVVATFIVDEQGRAEAGSIRFLRSDNALFEGSVTEALRSMRFVPAEAGGRKVRQLVEMPFVFKLSR